MPLPANKNYDEWTMIHIKKRTRNKVNSFVRKKGNTQDDVIWNALKKL